jgi:cardiolipin synthase
MRRQNKLIPILIIILSVLSSCASYGKLEKIDERFSIASEYYEDRGIPSYAGQSGDVYFNGKQWLERSLELIEGAEDYILIHSFLTTEHQHTRIVFDALKRKMDEGVRVFLIFDSASYYRAYPNSPEPIRAGIPYVKKLGIPYTEYNPICGRRVPLLLKLFDRDHRKYWIVDGKTVSCGGQNIDYDNLRFPEDAGLIDSMIEIESPGFTDEMLACFIKSWNRYSIHKLDQDDFENRSREFDQSVMVFNQGLSGGGQVTTMFDGFFTYAEEKIWMVQCYTFVTPALLDKIRYAVDRGVEVNFIISENQIGARFNLASHYSVKPLINAGANVYFFDSPDKSLLHYKLMLADDRYASIGSVNYNLRSQTTSRELSVVVEDEDTVEKVRENLNELLEHSRPVSYEEALTYQGFEYLANYILMQFWG